MLWLFSLLTPALAGAGLDSVGLSPRVERLTIADGLPDQTVFSIQRDRHGFLWLGTSAGAVRYDGQRFTVFRHDPDDPDSLSHDNASVLLIDHAGILWVGTWGGGLNRVEPDTGRIQSWRFDAADGNSMASDFVQCFLQDRQGRLWIGTGGGLMRFQDGRPVRAYTGSEAAQALGDRRIWSIAERADGHLWLATTGGLVEFSPDDGAARLHDVPVTKGANEGPVRMVHVDAADRIWVSGSAQFGRYDPEQHSFTEVSIPDSASPGRLTVNTALALDQRYVWLGTWSGVWLLDSDTARLSPIGRSGQLQWFAADDVRGLLRDPSGLLWAATRYNGVARIELTAPRIRIYQQELLNLGFGLDSTLVRAVYPGAGQIWLHTDGAVVRVDLDRGNFTAMEATRGYRAGRGGPGAFDSAGRVWLPTLQGPARLDLDDGQLTWFPELLRQSGLRDSYLLFVRRDRQDRLWWATQREGVLVSDLQGQLLRHYRAGAGADGEFPGQSPSTWAEDAQGRIWMGSDVGLSRLRADESGFDLYRHDPRQPRSLSHDRINVLVVDRAGILWIGTQRGLDRWDAAGQDVQRYSVIPGQRFPVEAIIESAEGELWVASAGQLHRFDSHRGSFVGAAIDAGERGLAFFPGASLRVDERRLLFGTNRGLLLFDPSREREQPFVPPAEVTAVWVDRQPLPISPGAVIEGHLQLPAGTRSLELQLSVLDMRDPGSNQVVYRLQGFDEDWVGAVSRSNPTYTNLAAGEYRLQVKVAGADRIWNDHAIDLRIEALQFWWEQRRLQALLALAVLALGYAAVRLYLRRLRRREYELERVVEERSRLIVRQQGQMAVQDKMASLGTLTAGVAHEINNPTNFAFVGAQNLESELSSFRRELNELAGDEAPPEVLGFFDERFSRLHAQVSVIREGADRIRTIVSHLRSFSRRDETQRKRANVDDGIASTVALVATQYRDRVAIHTQLRCDGDIDCRPAELNQVFMNLIVNACQAVETRHPDGGGLVSIRTVGDADGVTVEVADNGGGIPAELQARIFEPFYTTKAVGEGTGLGLSISYGIISDHGGRIDVNSETGRGSRFTVWLPRRVPAPG